MATCPLESARSVAAAAAVATVTRRERKKRGMKREIITFDESDRIVGNRPEHIHRNRNPKAKVQEWACNSPYCEELEGPHPDDGGPEPVVQGREPWRGSGR